MSLFARRAGAYALDCALLFAVLAPLSGLGLRVLEVDPAGVTGLPLYLVVVTSFSIPAWTYFVLGDADGGRTLGKRAAALRVALEDGEPMSVSQSFLRTAVKLAPWEVVHASFFLAPAVGAPATATWTGAVVAYGLVAVYLASAWRSRGRRSVHDRAVGSRVRRAPGLVLEAV